jgi:hypothetical protein
MPKQIQPYNTFPITIGLMLFIILTLKLSGSNFVFAQKPKESKSKIDTPESKDNKKAKETKKAKFADYGIELGLSTTYDDNILKYSDKYLSRFINNEDMGRFHINTYDDIILRPTFKFSASKRIFKKLRTEVDARLNMNQYYANDIKNWNFFMLGYRQFITRKASFRISYSYIPNFYIRHFRDEDWVKAFGYTPQTFKPMSFSKETYNFWVHNTFFKNTGVRLTFDYSNYHYNTHYTEYDSDDFSYEVIIFQPIAKGTRLQIKYEYTTSLAKGFDMPHETMDNSDDADATFNDDTFSISVTQQLPNLIGLSNELSVEARYGQRNFTSKRFFELDPLHAGRIDINYYFSTSYSIKISKSYNLSINYNYYKRNSDTLADDNRMLVSEEKSYRQNQIGIAFTYNFKL